MIQTCTALLCLFAVAVAAQDVAVTVSVDPYEVRIGDPVDIIISVTTLRANSIKLDPLPQGLAEAEVLSTEDRLETGWLGQQRLIRRVRLVPFAVGDVSLSPLNVEVIQADGTTSRTTTPLTVFAVRSVAPGEEGPTSARELKDIIEPSEESLPFFWLYIVAAVVLAAALIAWWFLRRRAPRSVRDLLKLTPAQRALHELQQLASSGLLESGKHREYYTSLADILRRYLGLRYHIFALEMTSSELRNRMERIWERSVELHDDLGKLLHECDLVKFAQFTPEAERGPVHIDEAARVIESTRDDREDDSTQTAEEAA